MGELETRHQVELKTHHVGDVCHRGELQQPVIRVSLRTVVWVSSETHRLGELETRYLGELETHHRG